MASLELHYSDTSIVTPASERSGVSPPVAMHWDAMNVSALCSYGGFTPRRSHVATSQRATGLRRRGFCFNYADRCTEVKFCGTQIVYSASKIFAVLGVTKTVSFGFRASAR